MCITRGSILAVQSVHITEFILDHNANPNVRNSRGETPLFAAAKRRELETAMFLWRRGADLDIEDEENTSALDIIRQGFQNPVIRVFEADKRMRRNQSVAMAFHVRLGEGSRLGLLEEEVVREFIVPYCKREEELDIEQN